MTRRLVLVGGGHAHAQVLEDWIRRPIDGVELWVVSPDARSPYSGMVPGWLAGLYDDDEICIDFASLCARALAVFVRDEMLGLDPVRRRIRLRGGVHVDYDVLSLDVGSTLHPPPISGAITLPLRPLSELRRRWHEVLAVLTSDRPDTPLTIVATGGGAAGFEALLALHRRITDAGQRRALHAVLTTKSRVLLPTLARGAARRATRVLGERGIELRVDTAFDATLDAAASRSAVPASHAIDRVVLWATGAEAHRWQASCGLAVDPHGYFVVDRYLRSKSHPDVFASGDCAAWDTPLPKAGVYAVRMGPVLVDNLRAAFGAGRARAYRPQKRTLVLLSTADRRAIASWGSLSVSGAWVWRWKDAIDRKFVRRFRPPRHASSTASRLKESS